jgi:hypothetical protein
MLINHHEGDFAPLPADAEIDIITKLRAAAAQPNAYLFPHHHNTNNDKKRQREKMSEGPAGTLTIFPKPTGQQMARNMLLSVLIYFAIALCIAYLAYLAALALPIKTAASAASSAAPSFLHIFQFTATAGLLDGLIARAVFAMLWQR